MKKMQAAVIASPRQIVIDRAAVPEPGTGKVLVRVEGCGVCASSLPIWQGKPWFQYPFEPGSPGHEGWGVVEKLGPGVKGVRVGDRIAFLSYRSFAEYDCPGVDELIRLPKRLGSEPFPGEALGCAFNVFRRCGVEAGDRVAVVGAGFLGLLLIRLCARAGARVVALSRRGFALERAREFGAHEVVPMRDHWEAINAVRSWSGGGGCECVIEAVGAQWPLDLAAELTCERGRLVIAGYHQDGPRQVNMQLWNWRGLDVINAHERDRKVYLEGMRAAAREVVSGSIEAGRLYTHRMPLQRLGEAFRLIEERPDGFVKALIEFDR